MAQIRAAALSSKEISDWHSRGRNYDLIVKIGTIVGLIKPQIMFENELCEVNKRGRTFIGFFFVVPRGRNFD